MHLHTALVHNHQITGIAGQMKSNRNTILPLSFYNQIANQLVDSRILFQSVRIYINGVLKIHQALLRFKNAKGWVGNLACGRGRNGTRH